MATYKKFATKDGTPIQVQSANEDGAGKNIQNNYAKQDGYYEGLTAGYADNLTPYSADSGVYQSIPYNFQPTGCGNGETQVDTGSFCQFKEKRGNGIVYNQLARPFENTYWTAINGTVSFDNGVATFVVSTPQTSNATRIYSKENYKITFTTNHKYIYICTAKYNNISGTKPTLSIATYSYDASDSGIYNEVGTLTSSYKTFAIIKDHSTKPTANYESRIGLYCKNDPAVGDSYSVKDFYVIDLTKWFNGNIPQYLLDHPESFFRYYSGDLSYNVGEIKFSNARYLKTYGRNQWDEEWELGVYNPTTGGKDVDPNHIRSKNYIEIAPNTKYYCYNGAGTMRIVYYDANKNIINFRNESNEVIHNPPNAKYITLSMIGTYGTTYNHDITISIYYDGESGYDEYYPFEQLQEVDTGTEQLYPFDVKYPSGLIVRNGGSYTFTGNESWTKRQSQTTTGLYGYYCSAFASLMKRGSGLDGLCDRYVADRDEWNYETGECVRFGQANDVLYIFLTEDLTTSQVASLVSGMTVWYQLKTPTTEQGTPFTESVKIHDFGSMSLESANGVPQGNLIFYPVDYKAYEDTLINYTDGDATSLAKKSEVVTRTTGSNKLYGRGSSAETVWDIGENNNNIPKYNDNTTGTVEGTGYLVTHTPANDYHVSTKKYVDDTGATKSPKGIARLV